MPPAADSSDRLVYTPLMPLQPTWTSVMSQDLVTTAGVPVDSTSATPVAPFTNAASGQAEALVLATLAGEGDARPRLCHLARNARTDAGWSLRPLFGSRIANEVASGTAYASTSDAACFGFFSDDSGLYATQLGSDGATWSDPYPLSPDAIANLKIAYSPAGRLVLYGNSSRGDLVIAYQASIGGGYVASTCAMQGGLIQGDFHLCLTDEAAWTLAANVNGRPTVYTGLIDAQQYSTIEDVTQFQGTLAQVVLGYWSAAQNTIMFMFADADRALHVWSTNDASAAVVQPIPHSEVTKAAGHVSTDQTLHVYSVDTRMNLWVLHQDPDNPWNEDGTPHWSPYIPLDTQVATVVSDTNPADAPSLFACDAADYSLRLHARDVRTGLWRSGPVLQDSAESFEVVRFRTEVTIRDANGVALPGYAVTLASADGHSGTEISVGGVTHAIDSDTPVTLQTDYTGKLTLATLTHAGLVTPGLTLQANGLTAPLTIQPAAPVHNYLAGLAPLNLTNPGGALPTFDQSGNALVAAKVNGQALAPGAQGPDHATLAGVAAQGIQQTALIGVGKTPPGIAGYSFRVAGPQGPTFALHRTAAEVEATRVQMFAGSGGELGSIWNQIEKWAGDVWEGIKNGLIQIAGVLVDAATQIATFTAKIGDIIADGIKLAVKGIEQAGHFIAGVFATVEAALEKVIDWLKAVFDFGAIWRTKKVFEQALVAMPGYINQLLAAGENGANAWFAAKEAQVNDAFDKAKTALAGQRFSDLQNFPTPGRPPSQQAVAGNASPSDLSSNVHHNWLQDKVASNTPPDFGVSPNNDLVNLWSSVEPQIVTAAQDFIAALTDFKNGITSTIQNPSSFVSVAIPDFLDAIKHVIHSMLSMCDAIFDLFIGVAKLAMDAVGSLFTTPLQLGPLNTLWKWIATQAGDASDDELTMAAVLALMAAFPATVAFKLVEGADAEPFPAGTATWRAAVSGASGELDDPMPKGRLEMAAILQIVYVVPALGSDTLGPDSPTALGLLLLGLSGLIWWLTYGFPDINLVIIGISSAAFVGSAGILTGLLKKILNAIKALTGAPLNDGLIVVFTVIGFIKYALLVLTLIQGPKPDVEAFVADVLLPLPYIMGLCNLTAFRSDILAPLFLAVVLVFDGIGYVGGGVMELLDAYFNAKPLSAATATA